MRVVRHPLPGAAPGTRHELISLHFGVSGQGQKVTIQASLHADEVPGMLVAHHLRQQLAALEAAGRMQGEVVLVPMANPLGLNQWLNRTPQGRFEWNTGENFNRHYADLTEAVFDELRGRLGSQAAANVVRVRQTLRKVVAALPAQTPLEGLRRTLLGLAVDADVVLDLHCDGEAVLHLYTTPDTWAQEGQVLTRALEADLALLAQHSGGDPFDEACSMVWPALADRLGPAHPLPAACLAATVELRGGADVRHEFAEQDAQRIINYLMHRGVVLPDAGQLPELPALRRQPFPLSGSIPLVAPRSGVAVYLQAPGLEVRAGLPLVDLIDPISGETETVCAPVDGYYFAHSQHRFALAGANLGKVAGRDALRSGSLLSA
jgi:uncharacterized protein